MGVYAHRFIEVLGKDNKWQVMPLWSKYKDDSYSQPNVVTDDLKLRKHNCFLRRVSSGFYSTGGSIRLRTLTCATSLKGAIQRRFGSKSVTSWRFWREKRELIKKS